MNNDMNIIGYLAQAGKCTLKKICVASPTLFRFGGRLGLQIPLLITA